MSVIALAVIGTIAPVPAMMAGHKLVVPEMVVATNTGCAFN
jgi:hypothetical protein